MAYCLYLRKSRADAEAEAHGEGETLSRHERILMELAKSRNLEITQIFREVVSGDSIAARPEMQRLLSEVGQGLWDGVLVVEIERLARGDTVDQGIVAQAFKLSGTKIITPAKVYDPENEFDEEYFEFGLFMSRREYKTINRRLRQGRFAAAKEGKWPSAMCPFGYTRRKLENDRGYILVPVESEAEIVRKIFSMFVDGDTDTHGNFRPLGIDSIATRLCALGIPSPAGVQWCRTTVQRILTNPVYVGKIRYGYHKVKSVHDGDELRKVTRPAPAEDVVIVDGLHPAIVDQAVYDRAQEIIAGHDHAPVGNTRELRNPLAGILRCGKCGHAMILRSNSRGPQYVCPIRGCPNVCSRASIVEKRIIESLTTWLAGYRLNFSAEDEDLLSSAVRSLRGDLQAATDALDRLHTQVSRTHDLLEQGIYDTDTFLERSRVLSERIVQAEAHLAEVADQLAQAELREQSRKDIIPNVQRVIDAYSSLETARQKNDLLKEVLDHVDYVKDTQQHRGGNLDDFELTIYPKLPRSP